MNVAAEMGFKFPETFEERARGKIRFLTKARDAHLMFSIDPKYGKKQRAWQAELARQAQAAIDTLTAKLAAKAA
jgi:hypothetical protein